MLVHSFIRDDAWLKDYIAFLELFGLEGRVNGLAFAKIIRDIELYLGWVKGDPAFLER